MTSRRTLNIKQARMPTRNNCRGAVVPFSWTPSLVLPLFCHVLWTYLRRSMPHFLLSMPSLGVLCIHLFYRSFTISRSIRRCLAAPRDAPVGVGDNAVPLRRATRRGILWWNITPLPHWCLFIDARPRSSSIFISPSTTSAYSTISRFSLLVPAWFKLVATLKRHGSLLGYDDGLGGRRRSLLAINATRKRRVANVTRCWRGRPGRRRFLRDSTLWPALLATT